MLASVKSPGVGVRMGSSNRRVSTVCRCAANPSSPLSDFQETFKKAMEKRRRLEQDRVSSLQELHDSASSAIKLMYAREMEFVATLCAKKRGSGGAADDDDDSDGDY